MLIDLLLIMVRGVDHVFCKTGNVLIRWLLELLFDLVLDLDIVGCKGLRIGSFSFESWNLLRVVMNFVNNAKLSLIVSVALNIWEEILDLRKLWHWNLIVELLMAWTMILVVGVI